MYTYRRVLSAGKGIAQRLPTAALLIVVLWVLGALVSAMALPPFVKSLLLEGMVYA